MLAKQSGVYMILHIGSDTRYVGSSAGRISDRWDSHRSALRHQKHRNPHLQSAWNKYGEDAFVFVVLENVAPADVLDAEEHWYQKFKRAGLRLYNIREHVKSQLGFKHSARSIEQISDANKRRVRSLGEREKLRQARLGKKLPEAVRERIAHDWPPLVAPDGGTHVIHNLLKFCQERQLDTSAMRKVALGQRRIYKGWRLLQVGEQAAPYTDKLRFVGVAYTVIDPQGKHHETTNIEAFARARDLDPKLLRNACRGKARQHKGWTGTSAGYAPKTTDNRIPPRARAFVAPDGTIHIAAAGLGAFCKQHGLDKGAMLRVHSGKQKVHLGWRKHYSPR